MAPNGGDRPYGTQEYAGDRAAEVARGQQHMPQEDRSSRHEIEGSIARSQAEALASEVRMGDDRVVVAPNWQGRTSTELHAAATQANAPTSADSLGRGFNDGGNRLAEAANRLYEAVGKLESAWEGAAADSARQALTPLAASTGQAGVTAQYMGAAMSRQAAAAAAVRSLPGPVEFDAATELNKALLNPNPIAGLADMSVKAERAKAVKQEQVGYLDTYTRTMAEVDSSTPSFVPPEPKIREGGGDDGFRGGGGVDYRGGPGGGRNPFPTGAGHQAVPSGHDQGSGAPPSTPQVPAVTGGGSGTSAAGYVPPGGATPTFTNPGHQGGQPIAGGGGPGFTGGPAFTGGPGGTGLGRGPGGPGAGGPGARGAGGPGNPGARGAGGAGGPGARGVAGGGDGGARGGARAGAGPVEESTRGRQGAQAGGGAGGRNAGGAGGGAGGGKGQGEEDTEHQRPSYLIEPDPEDTFGTDQITAPPVIGG